MGVEARRQRGFDVLRANERGEGDRRHSGSARLPLSDPGHEVQTAQDGLAAIEHCRHTPPHVLLMDLDMPILDGLAATRQLRVLQRAGAVAPFAIVAATADVSDEAREACLAAGMDGYMCKPLMLEELNLQLRRFTMPC